MLRTAPDSAARLKISCLPGHGVRHRLRVPEVALEDAHAAGLERVGAGRVLRARRRDDRHHLSLGHQAVGQVDADEPQPPDDERSRCRAHFCALRATHRQWRCASDWSRSSDSMAKSRCEQFFDAGFVGIQPAGQQAVAYRARPTDPGNTGSTSEPRRRLQRLLDRRRFGMHGRKDEPPAGPEPARHLRQERRLQRGVLGEHANRVDEIETGGAEILTEQVTVHERNVRDRDLVLVHRMPRPLEHRGRRIERRRGFARRAARRSSARSRTRDPARRSASRTGRRRSRRHDDKRCVRCTAIAAGRRAIDTARRRPRRRATRPSRPTASLSFAPRRVT